MKVLITGATGLVGSEIVKLFLQNGVQIHYLSSSKRKLEQKENYKGFYWNPATSEMDTNAFEGVTTIIHLAGASVAKRWTKSHKQEIIESRVLSTKLLFQYLAKNSHQVTHVISASAIGIYPHSFDAIYNESNLEVDDSFLGSVVAKWEDEINAFERLGIKVSKVRIGIVLAKKGGALQEMVKPISMGVGAAFGSGEQYQSWIHVQDLAQIFYFIMQYQYEGVFNGVSPYPVTNNEMTKAIGKVLGKPLFLPNIPKFVMKILLGEMHEILFSSQHVSARKLLDKGFQFQFAALDKALLNLLK
ncbi:TIGR01777 family oxidoreductase [Flavobacterium tibetense]|uniref:TIGR01777 family protein n=1 Tax=Flavobacterium tibetense TaxID=2233533 RepID=A0A365P2Q5_9FLAO|nr:TIGR01777 family oxidoreductase [Flavobacterium tibetense]RBA28777.1 TIGR01777 family protein [Flavobacterium tibetense]